MLPAEDGARTKTSISKSSSHPTAAWLQLRPSLAGSPAVSAFMKASSIADINGSSWLHRYRPASDAVASAMFTLQVLLESILNQMQDPCSTVAYWQFYKLSAKHHHKRPTELSVEAAAIDVIQVITWTSPCWALARCRTAAPQQDLPTRMCACCCQALQSAHHRMQWLVPQWLTQILLQRHTGT